MALFSPYILAFLACYFLRATAIVLNLNDSQSIRDAAATAAYWMQDLYNGNVTGGVPGKFPYPPYYWWESGGAWGGMMNYWHYTGDQSYVNVTHEALLSQVGPAYDFVVPSEAFDEGNDDQAFWVFAAMTAAEHGFPEPTPPVPSWLTTVQNAWELFTQRWNHDKATCNGGLKWQFHPENAGYFYKNSISNGAFFQLSARLARATGNNTYVEWAERIYNWTSAIGLIDNLYNVYDGSDETINCTEVDHTQWTYNIGVFLYGSAVMQNYTNASTIWVDRTTGLLDATTTFFSPYKNATNIMFEAKCELDYSCNVDQLSMKAYLARWLAGTSLMAPYTAGRVGTLLKASARGAAASCTGGPYGNICGTRWYINGFDNKVGLGQQLCATEIFYALMVNETAPPISGPGVVIRDEPDNIEIAASASLSQPPPGSTARPRFDGKHNAGSATAVASFSLAAAPLLVTMMI